MNKQITTSPKLRIRSQAKRNTTSFADLDRNALNLSFKKEKKKKRKTGLACTLWCADLEMDGMQLSATLLFLAPDA